MAGDLSNNREDIKLRIYPYPFFTSSQISSMSKKDRYTNPLNPKAPFKWVFMVIINLAAPKNLTVDTTFSHDILIIDAYSKTPKLYVMDKIITE